MPDFLTTPFLYLGLAAAALPVMLHLILRNRAETVYFGAMRFLAATSKKLLRRQRLKQILLLLLRVLALLLLGLVFARPLLVGEKLPALLGEEPRALVLVIDASASMAANKHLQAALNAARDLLRKTRSTDQVSVIVAADKIEVLAEKVEPAQAEAVLTHVQQRHAYGNLREALLFADNMLAQTSLPRRQIYLLSDLQASGFAPGNLSLKSGADCVPLPIAAPWQNVAITSGERLERNGKISYVCRVRSFAKTDQEVTLHLGLAAQMEKIAARKSIKLTAQEEQIVYFSAAEISNATALTSGVYFEAFAPSDDLPVDNRYYLAPENKQAARILLVSSNPESEFYVRQALELPGAAYRLGVSDPNGLETMPLASFDAVFYVGATGLNRNAAQNLLSYVQSGGGLIIALEEKPPLETFNIFLEQLLPGKVLASHNAARARRGGVTMTEVDFAHPVFNIFRDPSHGDPSTIQITRYYLLDPKPGAQRLAGFEDGNHALLERSVGQGKVLLWASTLNIDGGNFPVRSIFVPMMYQWIDYVRRAEAARTTPFVGQPIFLEQKINTAQAFAVHLPNGETKTIASANAAVFYETASNGFYTFQQGREEISYAVNIDSRESEPVAMAKEDVLARIDSAREPGALPTTLSSAAPSLHEQERHQKLWRMTMWLLLAVLLGEVWLANRTPR